MENKAAFKDSGLAAAAMVACRFGSDTLVRAAGGQALALTTRLMLSEGTAWSGAWTHLLPTLQDPKAFSSTKPWSLAVLSPADKPGPTFGHLVVPKRHWTMANYSHFVRPGWKLMRIDGVGLTNTGFVNPEGNGFVIVALNTSSKPQPATYEFGDWKIDRVQAFATTKDLDLGRVPSPSMQPHQFRTTLRPMSVTTFVGSARH